MGCYTTTTGDQPPTRLGGDKVGVSVALRDARPYETTGAVLRSRGRGREIPSRYVGGARGTCRSRRPRGGDVTDRYYNRITIRGVSGSPVAALRDEMGRMRPRRYVVCVQATTGWHVALVAWHRRRSRTRIALHACTRATWTLHEPTRAPDPVIFRSRY